MESQRAMTEQLTLSLAYTEQSWTQLNKHTHILALTVNYFNITASDNLYKMPGI